MSPRRIIFIAAALLISGLTIFLGRSWLQAQREAALQAQHHQPVAQSTMVLVAKGDLAAGQFVHPENLRWQAWPSENLSPNYVVQGQRALEDFIGAVVRSGISDGEPITEARLVRPGDRGFLAAVLTPGYRAVTVNVNPASGISGFIFPGDHVDLILTLSVTSGGGGSTKTESCKGKGGGYSCSTSQSSSQQRVNHVGETVLRDVRVLAMDQRADDQAKDVVVAKTATLEVTPKQAEVIAVVGEVGKLSLSLRALPRDETVEVADTERKGVTYTYDSDATRLIQGPNAHGEGGVDIVRGERKQTGTQWWF